MSAYLISLWALAIALLGQALATGCASEALLRQELAAGLRRVWMMMAIAALLLALFHGYTLELALRTGLYDLRQALLAALTSLLFALGLYGFRRQMA